MTSLSPEVWAVRHKTSMAFLGGTFQDIKGGGGTEQFIDRKYLLDLWVAEKRGAPKMG